MPEDIVIARNTEPGSTLPFLLRIPLGDGIILKAKNTWPRTGLASFGGANPVDLVCRSSVSCLMMYGSSPRVSVGSRSVRGSRG